MTIKFFYKFCFEFFNSNSNFKQIDLTTRKGKKCLNYFHLTFPLKEDGEMFDEYLTDLLEMAKTCDFCSSCQDSLVRDRIVVGLRDFEMIDKLLEEAGSNMQNLNFKTAKVKAYLSCI